LAYKHHRRIAFEALVDAHLLHSFMGGRPDVEYTVRVEDDFTICWRSNSLISGAAQSQRLFTGPHRSPRCPKYIRAACDFVIATDVKRPAWVLLDGKRHIIEVIGAGDL
jgi:hypothetical protein